MDRCCPALAPLLLAGHAVALKSPTPLCVARVVAIFIVSVPLPCAGLVVPLRVTVTAVCQLLP